MITRSCQKHEITFNLNYQDAGYEEMANNYKEINKMIEQGYKVVKIFGGTASCYIDLIKEIQ
jgi:hypothetical protein